MAEQQVDEWIDNELPPLNRAILRGDIAPSELAEQVRHAVLPYLPPISSLSPITAQQLVVRLGFLGASVARHYQEWTAGGKENPERSFVGLTVEAYDLPFQRYFAGVADRTGTGHCERDTLASLVRWNVGTIEVRTGSHLLATLPGIFNDGRIRSYTGTGGEERFFLLVKQGEAIELAVNQALEPLSSGDADLFGPDAIARVLLATDLIVALRRLFLDFASKPPEQSMPTDHFMDVFRQFAVHWTVGDIPPSGALDPEALKRDFLLGVGLPGYDQLVLRLFPALLTVERDAISALMARPTLPEQVLARLGWDPARLRDATPAQLRDLVAQAPALGPWFRLLAAHARTAGAHLMLSKKFLFKPQQVRDATGIGDRELVSNRAGTTGMNESFLDRLTQARRDHALAPLRITAGATTANTKNSIEIEVRSDSPAAATVAVVLMG